MVKKLMSLSFALTFALGAFHTAVYADSCTATNVVVAQLTDAHWTQGAPYNDYSPKGTTAFTSGWEAGCVAIAAAQELYYWQWPWSLGAVRETSHPVLNESNFALRFDGNVPFDWENMPNSFSSGGTLAQKHAVARLVLACQSLVQMQFVAAGGEAKKNLPGTMEWFEFGRQVDPKSGESALNALREDFEFGSPVQTGINFKGYGGHEVVGLGYATGTNSVGEAKNLIWLNLGWGGGSDGWYDLSEKTASETVIKSVQLGFRPIKSVQIEPIAPVSGDSVTLNWHLPNCYTNKISGFAVATKKLGTETTTWSDDFSTAKGRSNNANEVRIVNGALKAWDGTASGMYIWDEVIVPTADSVMTYDVGSSYMGGMSVRFEAKVDGMWRTLNTVAVNGGKEVNYYNWGTTTAANPVSLESLADKPVQLRFVVEYISGGVFSSDDASVKIDNLSVSNVKTFEMVGEPENINDINVRTKIFTGLENSETYAFAVTPIMSDESAAVTQTATTTIGTPVAKPGDIVVSSSRNSIGMIEEGFYLECGSGENVITVASANAVGLAAYPSHLSFVRDEDVSVEGGNGTWTVKIDGANATSLYDGVRTILTLVATNSQGAAVYKDMELHFSKTPTLGPRTYTVTATGSATEPMAFSGTTIDGNGKTLTIKSGAFTGSGNVTLQNGTFTIEDLDDYTGKVTIGSTALVTLPNDMSLFKGTIEICKDGFVLSSSIGPSATIKTAYGYGISLQNARLDCAIVGDATINVALGSSLLTNLNGYSGTIYAQGGALSIPAGREKNVWVYGGKLRLLLDEEQEAFGYTASSTIKYYIGSVVYVSRDNTEHSVSSPFAWAGIAKVWTPARTMDQYWDDFVPNYYNDTSLWSDGALPSDDDYVIFNAPFETPMSFNPPSSVHLKAIKVIGSGHLYIDYGNKINVTSDCIINETTLDISTEYLRPSRLQPHAQIVLNPGVQIDCEIDFTEADYVKTYHKSSTLSSAFIWDDIWHGTVVMAKQNAHISGNDYGNASSMLRMYGSSGSLSWNASDKVKLELTDPEGGVAYTWNNGYSGKTNNLASISGDGTLVINNRGASNDGPKSEKITVANISDFAGSIDISAKTLIIGKSVPAQTSTYGQLHINSDYSAAVAAGKTWTVGGGVYLDGATSILTVNGALDTTKVVALADNAQLTLADGGTIEIDSIDPASKRLNFNLYAGALKIDSDITATSGFCFSATNDTRTTLDTLGNTLTFSSGAISGHGAIYPFTSAEQKRGTVAFDNFGYWEGTLIYDGKTDIVLPSDLTDFNGTLYLDGADYALAYTNLCKVSVSAGARLTITLPDKERLLGAVITNVTLAVGGSLSVADKDGNVLGVFTSADSEDGKYTFIPGREAMSNQVSLLKRATAVWKTGEFGTEKNGYSIALNDNSVNDAKNILISDTASLGATITLPNNTYTKASVLVKYNAPYGGAPKANSVIAGMKDSASNIFGAICLNAQGNSATGYWIQNSNINASNYSFNNAPINDGNGWFLFSYHAIETDSGSDGAKFYSSATLDASMTGAQAGGLQFRKQKLSSVSVGGPAGPGGVPWAGLEISEIYLYVDEWFSPNDLFENTEVGVGYSEEGNAIVTNYLNAVQVPYAEMGLAVKYGPTDITGAFAIDGAGTTTRTLALDPDGIVNEVDVRPAIDEESSIASGKFTIKTIPGLWYGVKYGDALVGGDIGDAHNTTPEQATGFGDKELSAPNGGTSKFYRVRVGARRSDLE